MLTDNAYLHAALIDKGIEVVPVWSPEVRFLFTASADEADRQLRALAHRDGGVLSAEFEHELSHRRLALLSRNSRGTRILWLRFPGT